MASPGKRRYLSEDLFGAQHPLSSPYSHLPRRPSQPRMSRTIFAIPSGGMVCDERTPLVPNAALYISQHHDSTSSDTLIPSKSTYTPVPTQSCKSTIPDDTRSRHSRSLSDSDESFLSIPHSATSAALRYPSNWRTETRWLFVNSLPICATCLLQDSVNVASIFFLGHLGATELAASALAQMFANVTGWTVATGAVTALDTLCSQAWTGSGNKTLVGIHLQRALLVLGSLFAPVACIWFWSEPILLLLGQEPELAHHTSLFLRYLLIGAPAFIAFEAIKKYLQAQGIMHASTYVLLIASPVNVFLNWLLIWYEPVSFGFIGAPIATSISFWIMLLLIIGYIRFVDGSRAWGGWSIESLYGWWSFLHLAMPGILMVCTEFWAFEIGALAASYLGTASLASQSIILTTTTATFNVPMGISIAASNRIGNYLGAGAPDYAKCAAFVAYGFAWIAGSANGLVLLFLQDVWAYLFTSDMDVVAITSAILPLCALFQIADAISGVCGGIIRGMGRQKVGAYLNLVAYYACAIPLGFWLAFKAQPSLGLEGLWVGLCVALVITSSGQSLYLYFVDWKAEVDRCQARLDEEARAEELFKTVL